MVNNMWINRSRLVHLRGGSGCLTRALLITGEYVAAWKAEPSGELAVSVLLTPSGGSC